jgi:CSLREA domain-containing protein
MHDSPKQFQTRTPPQRGYMKSLALILVLLPVAVSAATITVNSATDNTAAGDGACTLREAIANVNAAADTTSGDCVPGSGTGDTITFSLTPSATIGLNHTLGELSIQGDVAITGPVTGVLRIDGAHKTRVFEIVAGTTNMSGLAIQGGRSADSGGGVFVGGGVLVDTGATLTLTNCALSGNAAGKGGNSDSSGTGGGIYNAGTLTLNNCVLSGNTAGGLSVGTGEAGGIYNGSTGTLTLTNCLLSHNGAFSGYSAFSGAGGTSTGAAISNHGMMTLSNCTISRNQCRVVYKVGTDAQGSSFGGGIENYGSATLNDCTLSYNLAGTGVALGYGGGGGIDNNGTATLSNCTLLGNSVTGGTESSVFGGGINNSGTTALSNCTIIGNTVRGGAHAWSNGGGIESAGDMTVTNCTLSHNRAVSGTPDDVSGGGIDSWGDPAPIVTNSIITASGLAGNCVNVASGGHNLDSDGTCFSSGGSDLLHVNPQLAPLSNYGGPTRTLALCTAAGVPHPACAAASPAIDAGDDSVTGPPDNLTTDQRGLPRLSGAHVDIGAYEVQQ